PLDELGLVRVTVAVLREQDAVVDEADERVAHRPAGYRARLRGPGGLPDAANPTGPCPAATPRNDALTPRTVSSTVPGAPRNVEARRRSVIPAVGGRTAATSHRGK